MEGQKISTSRNWLISASDLARQYAPDVIRYYFIANGPEKRDSDFSWSEFRKQNNSELVGAWGNLVNRTFTFITRCLNNRIPRTEIDAKLNDRVSRAFPEIGGLIENGRFRDALREIFDLIRFGNKYYDSREPWKTRSSDPEDCGRTICSCMYLIGNLAVLLHPFLPFTSSALLRWLGLTPEWKNQLFRAERIPEDYSVLFVRIGEGQ